MNKFISQFGDDWILCFIGEDQPVKLGHLAEQLDKPKDPDGNGKCVPSGFSYWGIVPTVAWRHTCQDQYYTLMSNGIRKFPAAWNSVKIALDGKTKHYVSLGPGTAEKDTAIIKTAQIKSGFKYIPIDMSAELLRLGARNVIRDCRLDRRGVIPLQIDFSSKENAQEIRRILQMVVGDEAVLFSLLGNTLANFESDDEILSNISLILRPQDYLVVELATSNVLSERLAKEAASEYNSKSFKDFAISSLLQNTNLPVEIKNIKFRTEVERDRALLIKCLYSNAGADTAFRVPGFDPIQFAAGDTIRLLITRKYAENGVKALFRGSGLKIIKSSYINISQRKDDAFGSTLFLLQSGGKRITEEVEFDFFIAHSEKDSSYANELYDHLVEMKASVFLAERTLEPGTNWMKIIPQKLTRSRATLVLMSANSSDAYYDKEEVAYAIDLARRAESQHRVIPIYVGESSDKESITPVYGLRSLQALDMRIIGSKRLAEKLTKSLPKD